MELDAVIFKMEERFTECKNGGVVHEDDLQYLEEMIKVLKNRQTNITAIISGTGDSFSAIPWGSPLISSPSVVALHAGVTAQQKNIEELKELKRSQEQELQALREKVRAKEAEKAAAAAAGGK